MSKAKRTAKERQAFLSKDAAKALETETNGATAEGLPAKPPSIWSVDADGTLKLNLHPGQSRVWSSQRRFLFMLAGTQGGKTSFGPWWLYNEIRRRGPADYLAVTGSFDLFKLKMLPTMREAFEGVLGIGRYWSGPGIIELADPKTGRFWADRSDSRMWGRIILRSAQSKGGLESTTAAAAWLDEAGQDAFSIETWEAVLRRLSLYMGRALVTTTIYNLGWLKTLYDQWEKGDTDIDVIQFKSTDNPAFTKEEFERAKRSMQEHRFKMFYEGQFQRPPGMIYNVPTDQIIRRFDIPPRWPRYVGIDFGAVNTALVWLAHDEERDRFYVYRALKQGNMTTEEHCRTVLQLAANENVVAWYGGAPSERQYRLDWMNEGVPIIQPPIYDVEAGIDRVTRLIKSGRLFIFDDLAELRDELQTYSRMMDDNGNVFDQIRDKQNYHLLDATRYISTAIVGAHILEAPSLWD